MSQAEIPRPDLEDRLVAAADSSRPVLLSGPLGSGKTTLLRSAARRLETLGWVPVYLDLMAAASSPERFVAAALRSLSASAFGELLPQALSIQSRAGSGRTQASAATLELLDLWAGLEQPQGRPVVLLLDEPTEIRSLAYFPDLRQVHGALGEALARRRRGTLLACSYPTQAARLWPGFETLGAAPLRPGQVADAAPPTVDAGALVRASFGWPRYLRILLEALREGEDVASTWSREMAPGGRLEQAARYAYETLLLRCRGYGMAKAVLGTVAREEGLTLSELVPRLGRSPGACRDYLGWLLNVDALRQEKKRYFFVDGLVRLWVRLHTSGTPPSQEEIRAAAIETIGLEASPLPPATRPVRRPEDSLMEID